MHAGILLNYVGAYPVAELHAAQKYNLLNEKIKVKAYIFGNSIKATNYNPFGRKMIQMYELARSKIVAEFLDAEISYIESIYSNSDIKNNVDKLTYKKLEFGVLSTLSSQTRIDDLKSLDGLWENSYHNLLNTAGNVYLNFKNEKKLGLNKIYIFNGRLTEDNAARQLAIKEEIPYKVYDFKFKKTYYEFDNCSLHSVEENCKRAENYYQIDKKAAHEVAKNFMVNKIKGLDTYQKSYIKSQKINFLNFEKKVNSKLISIYPSSDDEYKFLSPDWGRPTVSSQIDEINNLINSLPANKFQFVIRMHPNQIDLNIKTLNSYLQLKKSFPNCIVLLPQDKSSTYSLINESDYVICFCSIVGVEASYMRKRTIGIGGNPFYNLNILNNVINGKEASDLIKTNKVEIKNIEGSVIWMNYLWQYTQYNELIIQEKNKFPNFKFKLKSTYKLRLLQAPFRLEIALRKPQKINIIILIKWFKSVKNILLNKFNDN